MKLLFAAVATAYAQERVVLDKAASEKGAFSASCGNNNNCHLEGQNNSFYQSGPTGGCYCDEACHTKYNDCCHDMLYQCYNGEVDGLCPSSKCYHQNDQWYHGKDTSITCTMNNEDCLKTTCSMSGMTVELDVDLFHTNDQNADSFVNQLKAGTRNLSMNGVDLPSNAWTASGGIITVNVDYAGSNVSPTSSTDSNGKKFIHYAVSFASDGNHPGFPVIEFYVDTQINAECKYSADVIMEADGFWVNQEDVSMDLSADGDLSAECDCKFYEDAARTNQIMAHNIVNMGEMLYGEVSCNKMHGLNYKLTGVDVSDPNDANNTYDVVANAATVSYAVNPLTGVAATGDNVDFEYLSFGFQSYGGGGNQNEVNVQCSVELELA